MTTETQRFTVFANTLETGFSKYQRNQTSTQTTRTGDNDTKNLLRANWEEDYNRKAVTPTGDLLTESTEEDGTRTKTFTSAGSEPGDKQSLEITHQMDRKKETHNKQFQLIDTADYYNRTVVDNFTEETTSITGNYSASHSLGDDRESAVGGQLQASSTTTGSKKTGNKTTTEEFCYNDSCQEGNFERRATEEFSTTESARHEANESGGYKDVDGKREKSGSYGTTTTFKTVQNENSKDVTDYLGSESFASSEFDDDIEHTETVKENGSRGSDAPRPDRSKTERYKRVNSSKGVQKFDLPGTENDHTRTVRTTSNERWKLSKSGKLTGWTEGRIIAVGEGNGPFWTHPETGELVDSYNIAFPEGYDPYDVENPPPVPPMPDNTVDLPSRGGTGGAIGAGDLVGALGGSLGEFVAVYDAIPSDQLDRVIDSLSDADLSAVNDRVSQLPRNNRAAADGGSTLDWVQGGLDVAGLTPGLGIVPDGVNTVISVGRGDWVGAAANAMAMIPIIGQGTKGAQLGAKIAKGVEKMGGTVVVKVAKVAAKAIEQHHLLPKAKKFRKFFDKVGLDVEDFKIPLPKGKHRLKPDGIHTGSENWNKRWRDFFDTNPEAKKGEILDFLEKLRKDFGI